MFEKITLRDERNETDARYLSVSLKSGGDIVFEGQDIGDEVRECFNCAEYEWIWTIRAVNVPALNSALGNPKDIGDCLRQKFSGEKAANIGLFLKANAIPYETWSRVGD